MSNTKETILSVAKRLFLERGFDNVTLRDISDQCGISPGNLTYHFKKKEDLIVALLADDYEAVIKDIQTGECKTISNLIYSFDTLCGMAKNYPYYFQNLTLLASQYELVKEREVGFREKGAQFYRRAFKNLIESGLMRDDIPWRHYKNLSYALSLTSVAWDFNDEDFDYTDSLEALFNMLCSIVYPCLSADGVRHWNKQIELRAKRRKAALAVPAEASASSNPSPSAA